MVQNTRQGHLLIISSVTLGTQPVTPPRLPHSPVPHDREQERGSRQGTDSVSPVNLYQQPEPCSLGRKPGTQSSELGNQIGEAGNSISPALQETLGWLGSRP